MKVKYIDLEMGLLAVVIAFTAFINISTFVQFTESATAIDSTKNPIRTIRFLFRFKLCVAQKNRSKYKCV